MKTKRHMIWMLTAALVSLPTLGYADITKGKKIYMKKMKTACGYKGDTFAKKHTQDEWEKIYKSGKMLEEVRHICPKAKKVKEKHMKHIFDFVYEYASDSGKVPSC